VITIKLISYDNIAKNYQKIKEESKKKIYAVLKSDAYNHGIEKTAKTLIECGCNNFCVWDFEEAKLLREHNSDARILLLGDFQVELLKLYQDNKITVTLSDLNKLKFLIDTDIEFQIKVASKMKRFGLEVNEITQAMKIISEHSLKLTGIYCHFAHTKKEAEYQLEVTAFKEVIEKIEFKNIDIHCASSYGDYHLTFDNAIRIGIALYSFYPAMHIFGKVLKTSIVKKGEAISYASDYRLEKNSIVAIVNLGYADGLLKHNKGRLVQIGNKSFPIIGEICMNVCFILVDETVKIDDKVEFLGENITLDYLSIYLKQISHEILLSY